MIRAVNLDYDVQLRLTEGDRSDSGTIQRLYVPSSRGGLVRLDNLVKISEGISPSRIDRLDRQRMVALRGNVAPGFAMADRIEALRKATGSHEFAGSLYDHDCRPRARAGAHLHRIHLGLPAVDYLHVHDPGVAVRKHDSPAHDSA